MTIEELSRHIKRKYSIEADYPFKTSPSTAVFRHQDTRKWFAIVMSVELSKLDANRTGISLVMNVKCDPFLIRHYQREKGIYPAYHMNKANWISIVIDEAECSLIELLIKRSYDST